MSEPERRVECGEHGSSRATFVCQHLSSSERAGFHQGYDPEEPNAIFPDAWCDACENVRAQEDGWNDRSESFAGIQLLCSGCYLESRLRNWPEATDTEQTALIQRAFDYTQSQQEVIQEQYRLGDYERYDWDQETARLVFSHDGAARVVADIQFVGTVSTKSNSWLWSWANKSLLPPVHTSIRQVREYGEEHHLMKLACAYWLADEIDGWEMASVSAYLLNAKGVYRTPDQDGYIFMVITGVSWAQ